MKNQLVLVVIILINNIQLNVLLATRVTCVKTVFITPLSIINDQVNQNAVCVQLSLQIHLELLDFVFWFCSWSLWLFGLTFERRNNLNSQSFLRFSQTTLKQHQLQWTSTFSSQKHWQTLFQQDRYLVKQQTQSFHLIVS